MINQEKLEFAICAFQEANAGADNDHIAYWLKRLNGQQLRWLIHICKKLVVLAENELHVERPVRE